MIHGQGNFGSAAILTAVAVASKDILSREDDFLERYTDVNREADDAWEGHRHRYGMEKLSIKGGNQFGFTEVE